MQEIPYRVFMNNSLYFCLFIVFFNNYPRIPGPETAGTTSMPVTGHRGCTRSSRQGQQHGLQGSLWGRRERINKCSLRFAIVGMRCLD